MPLAQRLSLLLAATVFAASPANAQASKGDSVTQKVDAIFARWNSRESPGCALGVTRAGALVYERGYGMSNLEYDLPITPASIFHVASISKQFTAAAVALLAKQGRLSLDDDVRKHIRELPDYGQRITVRHLIHHTSGLRDQWDLLRLAGWRQDDVITEEDVLSIVARQKALNFTPGAEYVYSNTGYTLLAIIVKRVSGQSLREFADAHFFKPLGMTNTHFHDDHTMIVKNRTSAYQPRQGGGWRVSIPVFDTYGATSLFTTVGDLLRWEQNFANAKVGGRELIEEMQHSGTLNSGSSIGYGMGLSVGRYKGLRTVGHGGADAGYRSDVVRFPDQGLAVAAFCNLSVVNPGGLTRQVAEVYLAHDIRKAAPGSAPSTPASKVTVAAAELERLAGVYRNPANDELRRLSVREGALVVGQGTGPALIPISATRFRVPDQPVVIELAFIAANGDRPRELKVHTEGQPTLTFVREEPFTPSSAELVSFAGDYYSEEVGNTFTIALSDSGLVMRPRKGTEQRLQPLFRDAFQAGPIPLVKFTRNGYAGVTGLLVTTGRVRRLEFRRVQGDR